jgi:hypothetical protein
MLMDRHWTLTSKTTVSTTATLHYVDRDAKKESTALAGLLLKVMAGAFYMGMELHHLTIRVDGVSLRAIQAKWQRQTEVIHINARAWHETRRHR